MKLLFSLSIFASIALQAACSSPAAPAAPAAPAVAAKPPAAPSAASTAQQSMTTQEIVDQLQELMANGPTPSEITVPKADQKGLNNAKCASLCCSHAQKNPDSLDEGGLPGYVMAPFCDSATSSQKGEGGMPIPYGCSGSTVVQPIKSKANPNPPADTCRCECYYAMVQKGFDIQHYSFSAKTFSPTTFWKASDLTKTNYNQ